jgi:long-chain acyl-CoA synthetase
MIEDYSLETVLVDDYPIQTFKHRFKSVRALFDKAAATYGSRTFLVEGERRLTFTETKEKVQQMAALLQGRYEIHNGGHVGLLMENSITFIVSFLGIQQLGATAVVFNHHLTAAELARQLEISDLNLLICSPAFQDKIQSALPLSLGPKILCFSGLELDDPAFEKTIVTLPESDEDSVALILFTSGTTGLPKGTMITHRNLITSACKQGYYSLYKVPLNNPNESRTLLVAPLFHVLAIQEQLMGGIFSGTTLFILPLFKADQVPDLIVRERINVLTGTPTMYWLLLHKTPIRNYEVAIEIIKYGGAPMPPDLLEEMKAAFVGVRFVNGYGLTEASVITLLLNEYCEDRPTSVGQPALCSEVRFVDAFGETVGPGQIGELTVRGALVSRGYYKLKEETKQAYQEGWFHTGDMGYADEEGFIYLVGRSKEMINRGGEKVYPVEVENLLHLHPKILDVSVFGLPDPVMGESVACAVVLRPGVADLPIDEVRDFCRDKLACYKIPDKVFLVSDLPRNPGGKVVKKKLIETIQAAS